MIELKNVSKYYNNNGVVTLGLRNINLTLSKGEIVAIVGESGSGKSTLLNVICGVDTYEEGEMLFDGNETSYFNQNDMDVYRKKNVSFIYQTYNIIDSYTVLENVMLPLLIKGMDHKQAKKRALELIKQVNLTKRIKHRGIKLSGGEKQRCVIARALASDCKILACDEPTGNLDSKTGEEIIRLIKEVASDRLVLIVTHNYEQVESIASRMIRLNDGEIIEDVKKETVEDDGCEKMDLTVGKIKSRTLLKIALQNIKSTPKKNLFSLLVFLILSLIALFLYLSCVEASEQAKYNPYDGFANTLSNRLIVYSSDHSALDRTKLNDIKGSSYENAFYEDEVVYLSSSLFYINATLSMYMPTDLSDFNGKAVSSEQDAFIVLPTQMASMSYQLKESIGETVTVSQLSQELTLCGYAISADLVYPLCVTYLSMAEKYLDFYLEDLTVRYANDEEITSVIYPASKTEYTENTLIYSGPLDEEWPDFKLFWGGLYEINPTFKIEYKESKSKLVEFHIVEFPKLEETYELTVYADSVDSAIETIKKAGYSYFQPSKSGYVRLSASYLAFIMSFLVSMVAMMALTFISYVILSRVYSSKNKDYTIMRSLGLVKKQMAKIVHFEILITGFISSVLAVIGIYIVSLFVNSVHSLLYYNSLGFMILYFVLMLLFSYLISRRFNRRLFRFTVSTSIKGEVARND